MLSWTLATLVLWTVTRCQGEYSVYGRVEIEDSMSSYLKETTRYDPNNPFDLDIAPVNSIQADRLKKCELLIAIGSHITCTNVDSSYVETGDRNISGYVDGHATSARYRGIAGFVQLPHGEVLISDQANRCIRKLNRYTQSVSTFRCDNKNLTGYVPWETFNQPSTMQYDNVTNIVYLLDTKDGRSVIVGLELDTNRTFIAEPKPTEGEVIQDFTYDQPTRSFATVEDSLLVNFTSSGENSTHRFLRSHSAIASYDDIYVLTVAAGYANIYDGRENRTLLNLCLTFDPVSCDLYKPTAAAVIGDYLYIGESSRQSKRSDSISAHVHRIRFTTNSGRNTSQQVAIICYALGCVSVIILVIYSIYTHRERFTKCKRKQSIPEQSENPVSNPLTNITVVTPNAFVIRKDDSPPPYESLQHQPQELLPAYEQCK